MERRDVFTRENGRFYLTGKRKRRTLHESWANPPLIQFGFVISEDGRRLYTILGDRVQINADHIAMVFQYWVIYKRGNTQYVTYLEPFGLEFRTVGEIMACRIGLLSYSGCVISNRPNIWEVFKYDYGDIIPDDRHPISTVDPRRVEEFVRKGFTIEYLQYLAGNMRLPPVDVNRLWRMTNDNFIKIMFDIYEMSKHYSLNDISTTMGLRPGMVVTLKQFGKFVILPGMASR